MAYDDRYGITHFKSDERNSLSISRDNLEDEVIPVLLFTPYLGRSEHHHIELTKDQAKTLHTWLGKYLEDE